MPTRFQPYIFVVHMQCRVTLIEERFVFEIVKTYLEYGVVMYYYFMKCYVTTYFVYVYDE